jgi:transcriptional regulator GlxA family with amidase domain
VVDDGDLVTAGGVTSGIDMALWLVERHFGAGLADTVAAEIEHPRHGEVWRPRPGPASVR